MLNALFLLLTTAVMVATAPGLSSPNNATLPSTIAAVDSDCSTRSLYSIIWGCLATLFACSWSAYHPDVPDAEDRERRTFLGVVPYSGASWWRVFWLLVTIMGTEGVLVIAVHEYLDARDLVMQSRRGGHEISMVHGFFLKMGGFVDPDGQICEPPDDPEDFSRVAAVKADDIMDKSKSDGLKKLILTGQILWFVIQFVARLPQGSKATTHLEVVTMAIAAMSCTTSLFWWRKPFDVQKPIILPLAPSSAETTVDSTDTVHPHKSKWLRKGLYARIGAIETMAVDCLRYHNFAHGCIMALVGTIFGALHCLAWNYPFPTEVEAWMWRTMSITIIVTFWIGVLCPHLNCEFFMWDVLLPLYMIARLGLIALAFSSLRSLYPAAFCVVPWTTYIPHIN